MRQLNVQPNRNAARLIRALVGGFHNTGAAAADNAKTGFYQQMRNLFCVFIFDRIRFAPGSTKKGYALDLKCIERIEGFDHFGHDTEGAPGFCSDGSEIVNHVLLHFRHECSLFLKYGGRPRYATYAAWPQVSVYVALGAKAIAGLPPGPCLTLGRACGYEKKSTCVFSLLYSSMARCLRPHRPPTLTGGSDESTISGRGANRDWFMLYG